jgi:hypothetical protein
MAHGKGAPPRFTLSYGYSVAFNQSPKLTFILRTSLEERSHELP